MTSHGRLLFPVSSKDDTHQILCVAYISWCGQEAHDAENLESQHGITELICSDTHTHIHTQSTDRISISLALEFLHYRILYIIQVFHNRRT